MDNEVYSFIQHLVPIERGIPPRQPPCFQCTYDTARHIHSASVLINYKDTVELVKKTLCFVGQSAIKRCSNCDQANEQRCYDCPRELASLRDKLWGWLSRVDINSTSTGADRTDVNYHPLSLLRISAAGFLEHTRLFLQKHNLEDFNQLQSDLKAPVPKLVEWGCIDVSVTQQAEQQHQQWQQEVEWDLSPPFTSAAQQKEQQQQQQHQKQVLQGPSPLRSPSAEPYYSSLTFTRGCNPSSSPNPKSASSSKQQPLSQSQPQRDEIKKIHATLENIQVQLHTMLVTLSSMSRNHRREAIAHHEEIKELLICSRNNNDKDKGNGIDKGQCLDRGQGKDNGDNSDNRDSSNSSLSSSAPLGPSFLHPSSPISNDGEGSSNRDGFNPAPGGPCSIPPRLSSHIPD
ncbi:hypothetical protein QBC32DRAFT_80133 [Pseudoneurospora amorphoporcata]|uniref:Uncharacterized protein n=1 Tax=Pseudoneurospora amorphoporcata TaxID=241081 RepID=A0AAN6SHK5_9PEZI|nr:hypothetical protein QBC32DRAFT_80133 [Pseudoneurospora amorphoporcata]